jgi:hypothetical protein
MLVVYTKIRENVYEMLARSLDANTSHNFFPICNIIYATNESRV